MSAVMLVASRADRCGLQFLAHNNLCDSRIAVCSVVTRKDLVSLAN